MTEPEPYADDVAMVGDPVRDFNYLLREVERLREALEFYADPKHWESVMVEDYGDGHQTWESGAAVDGGARARAVLVFRTTQSDGTGCAP